MHETMGQILQEKKELYWPKTSNFPNNSMLISNIFGIYQYILFTETENQRKRTSVTEC